jgi:sec-independent protein translocase protein TatA
MFGLGLPEILVIFAIIFLLFGAKRLPDIGAGLGKTVRELRRIRDDRRGEKKSDKGDRKGNLIADLKKEVEEIPGLKEARKIQETAKQVKDITKFLK